MQDATPAALVAHVTSRKCYGPSATSEKCPGNALEKGGKGSITEQLLNARADVTLGGGAKTFAETATAGEWQGKTLREQAQARGYQLVSDAASLNSVTEANQQKPLLGLFADGNMPVRWLDRKQRTTAISISPQSPVRLIRNVMTVYQPWRRWPTKPLNC